MRVIYYIFPLLGILHVSINFVAGVKNDFNALGRELYLSPIEIQNLNDIYLEVSTDNESLELACLTAKATLGEAQVDIHPVDETIIEENWTQTCWATPYCIVQPRDASEVSKSLQIISFFQIRFAVRSGGHSPNPGSSSIGNHGLLLSLERLNAVSLSPDGTFASVEPGARWGNVQATLSVAGAVVIGGRTPTIGVGGLILGGGYSHVSNQFGLAADNVKEFEVVLANGTIIQASAQLNLDLFVALKGGGPNFGIVTRYDLYTVPVGKLWVQINTYSVDQAFAVLATFDSWQGTGASDVRSNVELNIALDYVAVILVYSEPSAQPPSAFSAFFDSSGVQPVEVSLPGTNMTLHELDMLLGSITTTVPARHDYRGYSTRIDTNLTQAIYSFWREKALGVRTRTGANQTFVLQHVGSNLIQQGVDKGGNSLNIPPGTQQWWTTLIDWSEAADDDLVRSVSVATTTQWEALGAQRGSSLSFIYMNDASRDQNPLASYGPEAIEKLRQVASRYDPNRIFQTLQNGGFLLSNA